MADIVVDLPDGNQALFPEGTPQSVMENALLEYTKREAGTPPDVPALPPGGAKLKETEPPSALDEFIRDLPAMAGGIAAPYAAGKLGAVAALPSLAKRGVQIGAAGIGGAIGELGQAAGEFGFGSERAPQTAGELGRRVGMAGAEQAAFEGIGQLAVKVAQGVGKAVPSISNLNKALTQKFREYGGELTPASVTDSWWIKQLDSLSRGSLTGSGIFKTRDVANEEAFKRMEKNLAESIAKRTTELSDQELGNLFLTTVKDGRAAHSTAAGRMYAELDSLVAPTLTESTQLTKVPTGLVGAGGQPLSRDVAEKVMTETGGAPVDVAGIKKIAQETLQQFSRIADIGAGEVGGQLLKQVASLPEKRTFQDAHLLRSNLLSMQRDLQGVVGAGKMRNLIGDLVTSLNTSMDKAAMEAGPDIAKMYAKVNKFYKQGKESFDNDFIAGLVLASKKNPERIGETIFRDGNVAEILQAKQAIKAAAKMDKTFKSEDVWNQMQAGYLQNTLSRFSTAEGVVDATRLAKAFVNPKTRRSLQAAFTKEQRDKILEFALVGERLQKAPEGGLGMVMNIAQAGTIVAAAQAPFTGYQVFEPSSAVAVLMGPRVMAHMLTSPKMVDTMIAATKTPANSLEGGKIAAKLVAEYNKIATDLDENVLEQYYPPAGEGIQVLPSRY